MGACRCHRVESPRRGAGPGPEVSPTDPHVLHHPEARAAPYLRSIPGEGALAMRVLFVLPDLPADTAGKVVAAMWDAAQGEGVQPQECWRDPLPGETPTAVVNTAAARGDSG